MPKLKLHWQIIIALVLAVFVGWLTGEDASIFGVTFYSIFEFVGKISYNFKLVIRAEISRIDIQHPDGTVTRYAQINW